MRTARSAVTQVACVSLLADRSPGSRRCTARAQRIAPRPDTPADPRQAASSDPTFVGRRRCAQCHESEHGRGPPRGTQRCCSRPRRRACSATSRRAAVTLRGTRVHARRAAGDRFTIAGPFPTARDEVHRVDYTLGSRRVQHYLTTLPDGRIVVLPPTWDVERREWIHNLDIVNPDEATPNPVQVWNSNCFGCHVSAASEGVRPGARPLRRRDGRTSARAASGATVPAPRTPRATLPASRAGVRAPSAMVVPTALTAGTIDDGLRAVPFAARHHGAGLPRRRRLLRSLHAGAGVRTEGRQAIPPYWADGRPRRFSNDAIGFWQSRCYLERRRDLRDVPRRSAQAGHRSQSAARADEQRALCRLSCSRSRPTRRVIRGTRPAARAAPASRVTCRARSISLRVAHAGPHDQRPGAGEHRPIRHSERLLRVPPGQGCRPGR